MPPVHRLASLRHFPRLAVVLRSEAQEERHGFLRPRCRIGIVFGVRAEAAPQHLRVDDAGDHGHGWPFIRIPSIQVVTSCSTAGRPSAKTPIRTTRCKPRNCRTGPCWTSALRRPIARPRRSWMRDSSMKSGCHERLGKMDRPRGPDWFQAHCKREVSAGQGDPSCRGRWGARVPGIVIPGGQSLAA